MLNNVRDFGAVGDGITDDRLAIQTAIDDAVSNNIGGIFFPAGTYRVSRVAVTGSGGCSLELNGVQDFMVMGEGPKSAVKLVDTDAETGNTGDWFVFLLHNKCQKVVFKDLVIDGNRFGLTNPDQQSHGIEIESGTKDLVVDRCILRDCFGDGMKVLGGEGQADLHSKRLRIENCLFQKNKRSGLVIQRATEQIIIANCVFDETESDNSIDIEPSSTDAPTDVVIQGCIVNHTNAAKAVSLVGISGSRPLTRCKLTDNIILGGPIFCADVNQLTIQNNIIQVTNRKFGVRIPIDIQRGGDSVMISGNLVQDDSGAEAVIRLSEVNSRQVTRALVADNLCFARSGSGIVCQGSDDVAIQGNMIVATSSCVNAIFLLAEQSPMDHVSVRDNDIMVKGRGKWQVGVKIAPKKTDTNPGHIGHVSVIGNAVRGATVGVSFENNPFTQTPVCALNRIADGVKTPLEGLQFLPENSLVVGGATSRGGTTASSGAGRLIAGLGSPDGKVIGNVGDIFQRLDGTPGKTLYVKEAGNGTKVGWAEK